MKTKRKHLLRAWLAVCVFLVGMTALQGCESSQGDSQAIAEARREMDEQRRKAIIMSEPQTELVQTAEQTTCPIMGSGIDKAVFTVYKGKKVYFCCAGCETPFLKNPEKYLSKLPQFKN
jgi:YHS domain-containing protein